MFYRNILLSNLLNSMNILYLFNVMINSDNYILGMVGHMVLYVEKN